MVHMARRTQQGTLSLVQHMEAAKPVGAPEMGQPRWASELPRGL